MNDRTPEPYKNRMKLTRRQIVEANRLRRISNRQFADVPRKNYLGNRALRCCYCKEELTETNYTREHLLPKYFRFGLHMATRRPKFVEGYQNIWPCCIDCNFEKAQMSILEYIEYLQALNCNDSFEIQKNLLKIENAKELSNHLKHIMR